VAKGDGDILDPARAAQLGQEGRVAGGVVAEAVVLPHHHGPGGEAVEQQLVGERPRTARSQISARTRWPNLQVLSTQTAPGALPPAFGAATLNRPCRLNVFTPRNLPCRRTPRAGQPMTATDELNRALLSLAADGDRPRCSDPITRELWTAEHAAHRAIAVKWCKRCPVLVLCRQAAEERNEQFGVWGGVDRSIRPGRKVA
jgi:Transcription factor WhiB